MTAVLLPVPDWRLVRFFAMAVCCLLFAGYIGWVHWNIIDAPAQLDLTEGATVTQVQGIMAGISIYSVAGQPEYFNLYGIGYPLFHTVISLLMGNTLRAGRGASAMLIALSTVLMFAITRRKTSLINAFILTIFFYAACTYWETPLDRPDTLGLLCYVAGIALIETFGPSVPALLGVTAISMAGFMIKPYFVLIGPIAISYVFFRHSRRIGLLFTGVWVAAFAMLLLAINATMPFYLTDVVGAQSVASKARITVESTEYMLRQVVAFFGFLAGPVWLVLLGILVRVTQRPAWTSLGWRWSFAAYGSAISGLILVGKVGHSDGNWLVYFFHLLLPFFIVWLAEQVPELDDLPTPISLLAVVGIYASAAFTSFHGLWSPQEITRLSAVWGEIDALIQPRAQVLGSPAIDGLLVERGRPIFDSGHTGYFPLSKDPAALRLGALTESRDSVTAIWNRYCDHLRTLIADRQFDMIIQSPVDGHNNTEPSCIAGIPVTYRLSAELPFHLPWVKWLRVWVPKPSE